MDCAIEFFSDGKNDMRVVFLFLAISPVLAHDMAATIPLTKKINALGKIGYDETPEATISA